MMTLVDPSPLSIFSYTFGISAPHLLHSMAFFAGNPTLHFSPSVGPKLARSNLMSCVCRTVEWKGPSTKLTPSCPAYTRSRSHVDLS